MSVMTSGEEAGLAPDGTDSVIMDVCNYVAGFVNSSGTGGSIRLNQNKVPEELKRVTLVLCREAILANSPNMASLEGSVREAEYRNAINILNDVAEGTYLLSSFSSSIRAGDVIMGGNPRETFEF